MPEVEMMVSMSHVLQDETGMVVSITGRLLREVPASIIANLSLTQTIAAGFPICNCLQHGKDLIFLLE